MNTQTPKPRIFLENTPTVERIVPMLAAAIGLNESILLLQIDFWIGQTNLYRDGYWWTYQSLRDMREKAFPYWSVMTIQRTIQSLAKMNLIRVTDQYNERKGDKTQWFSLNVGALNNLAARVPDMQIFAGVSAEAEGVYQNDTTPYQFDTTLPENTPEIRKDSMARTAPDAPSTPARPPRKRKTPVVSDYGEVFACIAKESFGLESDIPSALAKRIGTLASWCAGDYLLARDDLERFYGWYDKATDGAARPRDLARLQSWVLRWRDEGSVSAPSLLAGLTIIE